MSTRMPTFFIPHGAGPCFFMQWNPSDMWDSMGTFLSTLQEQLPQPVKAIVLISAHWITPHARVTAQAKPGLIYDYYGFPEHTYALQYPAPGSPSLAQKIAQLLSQQGLECQLEHSRGWDHGVFIPLKLIAPSAEIPVVQLSLVEGLDAAQHLAIGAALEPLRDENVLIIGSGMSFHNMRAYGNPAFTPIAQTFDDWLTQTVVAAPKARHHALLNWSNAPGARESHPLHQEEHLLPLMVVAGAAREGVGRPVFNDQVLEVAISGFRFD